MKQSPTSQIKWEIIQIFVAFSESPNFTKISVILFLIIFISLVKKYINLIISQIGIRIGTIQVLRQQRGGWGQ